MTEQSPAPTDCTIRVAAVPLNIKWADVDANLRRCDEILAGISPDTDIVVFPELFTTAFIVDTQILADAAEAPGGKTMKWAAERARRYNMAIAGSYLTVKDGKYYNTAFFMTPEGEATFYDKHHLFCLSPEATLYGQGTHEMPVVEFRGWRVAMIVCYDMRFPVWCRNAERRYDIMLVAANWPTARGYAWHSLIVARAIENQTPWVGADRSGRDDYGEYDGLAEICDAMGQPVAQASAESPEDTLYATFSKNQLNRICNKLPVGRDADGFTLLPDLPLTPAPRQRF